MTGKRGIDAILANGTEAPGHPDLLAHFLRQTAVGHVNIRGQILRHFGINNAHLDFRTQAIQVSHLLRFHRLEAPG